MPAVFYSLPLLPANVAKKPFSREWLKNNEWTGFQIPATRYSTVVNISSSSSSSSIAGVSVIRDDHIGLVILNVHN